MQQLYSFVRAQTIDLSTTDAVCGAQSGDGSQDPGFPYARAINVGVAGALKVTTLSGDVVVITAAAGVLYICVSKIWKTGTTATSLTAFY